MTAANFKASLTLILKSEGGNDDDPHDNGGRTSRGITQRVYDRWRISRNKPTQDVWTATQAEVEQIYHDDYWMPHGDNLPIGLDYLFFDMAINAGPHRAAVLLQRTLGVAEDGKIGPITMGALKAAAPAGLIDRYTKTKRAFYISLNQPRFTKGWLNRCDFVQANAKRMIK